MCSNLLVESLRPLQRKNVICDEPSLGLFDPAKKENTILLTRANGEEKMNLFGNRSTSSILRVFLFACLVLCLALYPFAFRIDFSKSNYQPLDIILMVPAWSWILLSISCILFGSYVLLTRKFGLLELLISILLFYGLFFLTQFPVPLQMDVLVHSGTAKQIALSGTIPGNNSNAGSWPGSYLVFAAFLDLTGMDTLLGNAVLAIASMLISSLALYLLGRRFAGPQWAGLPGLVYIVAGPFGFQFLDRDRFSPFNMAFALTLICLYTIVRFYSYTISRPYWILLILLTFAIVISHIEAGFFILCLLFGLEFIKRLRRLSDRPSSLLMFIFVFTLFLSWWFFESPNTFTIAFSAVRSFFSGGAKIGGLASSAGISTTFAHLLTYYYFRAVAFLLIIFALGALVKLRKRKQANLLSALFLTMLIFSSISLSLPGLSSAVEWSRVLALGLIPPSLIACILLPMLKKHTRLVAFVIIMLILPSFLTSQAFASTYVEAVHPWEMQTFEFMSTKMSGHLYFEGDELARAFNSFYNLNGTFVTVDLSLININYTYRLQKYPHFFGGDVILRSFRQELRSSQVLGPLKSQELWRHVDASLNADPLFEKVFDSGLSQVYTNQVSK